MNINKTQAKIAIDVLQFMINAKKQQIQIEPNEIMWKDELKQLYNAKELIEMDMEFFS